MQTICPGYTKLWAFFLAIAFCMLPAFCLAAGIHSRAAVVMDASTGRLLYAKNPDLRCPPASTTKLMTAIVVIENADLHNITTISRNASRVSPHKAGFRAGDRLTIEKLLFAALLGSANDAAVALAEAVAGSEPKFVALMNQKALSIGATDTKFINASGLPGKGQYTTASDLSKIMEYALRYQKLKEIIGTRATEISTRGGDSIYLRNTNRLLWSDEDLVGGKTGYTRKARHCFVCAAERQNETIIVALLGSPSRSGLWRESETLINRGFEVISNDEKPTVYFTKAVYSEPEVKKPEVKKKSKIKKKKKSKGDTKLVKKGLKNKKTKALAKNNKHKKRAIAKHKGGKKNYRIAEKNKTDGHEG